MMDDNTTLREIYRLTQDNNRMLHSMRRTAFLGGLIKIFVWVVIVATPIWFYITYLAPVAESVSQTVSQVQNSSNEAKSQVQQLQGSLKKVQEALKLPSLPSAMSFPRLSSSTPQ